LARKTGGPTGRYQLSRCPSVLTLGKRPSIPSCARSRVTHRVSQCASLFLGLGLILRSYHMRELLVCWLCFSVAFVSLTLVILAAILTCYAGRYIIEWASAVVRVIRPPSLTYAKLSQNKIYLFPSRGGIVGTEVGNGSGTLQPCSAASPIAARGSAHLS
jgi:hypothetical protein